MVCAKSESGMNFTNFMSLEFINNLENNTIENVQHLIRLVWIPC